MALIKCEECGHQVSDTAKACQGEKKGTLPFVSNQDK